MSKVIIINNNNHWLLLFKNWLLTSFLYSALPKSLTMIKAPAIYYYHCHQEIITILSLHFRMLIIVHSSAVRIQDFFQEKWSKRCNGIYHTQPPWMVRLKDMCSHSKEASVPARTVKLICNKDYNFLLTLIERQSMQQLDTLQIQTSYSKLDRKYHQQVRSSEVQLC